MNINNKNNDSPDYVFIAGVSFFAFIIYAYFLYVGDRLGFIAAAGFFILYVAEHLFNFISHTDGRLSQFKDSNLQRPIAFVVPIVLILLSGVIIQAI